MSGMIPRSTRCAECVQLAAERDAWKALAEARERLITAFYRGADRLDRVPACQGIDAALAELRRLGIEP